MRDAAPLLGTVAAYVAASRVAPRFRTPLANPTLLAIAAVGVALVLLRVPYPRYAHAAAPLTALLGPSVVALAIPLHRERRTLARHAGPLVLGAVLGGCCALAIGWAAGHLLALSAPWALALDSRSATSPISIALADQLDGVGSLSAIVSVLSGLLGAAVGPRWLDLVRVEHPLARGLALGVTSHGLGTARMLAETPVAGATATLGMALGGLVVALVLPSLWGM